jgi:hypothetical protein
MFAFIPRSTLVRKLVMFFSRKLVWHLRTIRSVYSLIPGVTKRWKSNSSVVRSCLPLSPQTLSLEHMTRLWRHHSKYVTTFQSNVLLNTASRNVFDSGYHNRPRCIGIRCVHVRAQHILQSLVQSWQTFLRVRALIIHNFEEILSRACENF